MADITDFDLTWALPFDDDAHDPAAPQKELDPAGPLVLGADFAYIGRALTADEFDAYVKTYNFGSVPPDMVILHHSAVPSTLAARYPTGAVWDANEAGLNEAQIKAKRLRQLGKIRDYYRDSLGWHAGPHLFCDERYIWLFTPMYDVGIHARSGNSYRDARGRLHYSIGLEAIGYYERVRWPAAVERNVGRAVVSLQRRLRTFTLDYKPGPLNTPQAHVGSISSHRDYGKPQCPGKAITEQYYIGVLRRAAGQR